MENIHESISSKIPTSSAIPPATGSSIINIGATERIVSVLGGSALAALGFRSIRERNGMVMALAGGYLVMRGLTGFCAINKLLNRNTHVKKASAIEVTGTFTINKSREEVYAYWRNLENLPGFMKHLEDVDVLDDRRSSWKARIPGGIGTISWEAEITEDEPGSYLAWCSLPGSVIDNAGEVRFADAPGNSGTEVRAEITYRLPAGDVGSAVGKLFSPVVEQIVREDIRRFKDIMESGELSVMEDRLSMGERDKGKVGTSKRTSANKPDQDYESTMLERS